jgi:hypothetical protein
MIIGMGHLCCYAGLDHARCQPHTMYVVGTLLAGAYIVACASICQSLCQGQKIAQMQNDLAEALMLSCCLFLPVSLGDIDPSLLIRTN